MGRLAFRVAWDCTDVEVVHINEIKGGPATAGHLLEFDSVHGRWSKSIKTEADGLTVEGRSIKFTAESKLNEVP
jgi:glyceraldehyde 3-phosphate dehydrogenase